MTPATGENYRNHCVMDNLQILKIVRQAAEPILGLIKFQLSETATLCFIQNVFFK